MVEVSQASNKDTMVKSLRCIFAASVLLVGGYYELCCALMTVSLLIFLFITGAHRKLVYRWNTALLTAFVVFLFFTLSIFYAVDHGLAVWGAVRYLPLPLMVLSLMQLESRERQAVIADIPLLGAVMTLGSFVLRFIPACTGLFTVSGRLAGFFQYPNTFAIFLLLGMEVLIFRQTEKKGHACLLLLILAFGIAQSASRAVLVLLLVFGTASLVMAKLPRKECLIKAGMMAVGWGAGYGVSAWITSTVTEHLSDMSAQASTLLGRLLYWKDALPVIAQHPFGLGYLGYYFTQGGFQRGVYSVRWIHNDLLQLLLDVGWIPAILAVIAVVQALHTKRVSLLQKMLLLTLLAHCMFDFDLAFIALYFVVFLCLDLEAGVPRVMKLPHMATAVILSLFALYIGVASTLSYAGQADAALKLYPWDTFSQIQRLTRETDGNALESEANAILRQNENVAIAWDAKANAAYAAGDFGEVIRCKQKAISLSKYAIEEYEDYFEKLKVGYELYLHSGNEASASVCREQLLAIPSLTQDVFQQTDPLSWHIADVPELTLPNFMIAYINALSKK